MRSVWSKTTKLQVTGFKAKGCAGGSYLGDADDEGGAAREAGDDGARQEVGQEAQPQGADRDVHEAHHQRYLPPIGMRTVS